MRALSLYPALIAYFLLSSISAAADSTPVVDLSLGQSYSNVETYGISVEQGTRNSTGSRTSDAILDNAALVRLNSSDSFQIGSDRSLGRIGVSSDDSCIDFFAFQTEAQDAVQAKKIMFDLASALHFSADTFDQYIDRGELIRRYHWASSGNLEPYFWAIEVTAPAGMPWPCYFKIYIAWDITTIDKLAPKASMMRSLRIREVEQGAAANP